jgi:hypothetical protein
MRVLEISHQSLEQILQAVFEADKSLPIRVVGSSMAPSIREGEKVLISPVKGADLNGGDVVLFRSLKGRLVAHRIVGMIWGPGPDSKRIRVRGDAHPWSTEISESQIIGRVTVLKSPDRGAENRQWGWGTVRSLAVRLFRIPRTCIITWKIWFIGSLK